MIAPSWLPEVPIIIKHLSLLIDVPGSPCSLHETRPDQLTRYEDGRRVVPATKSEEGKRTNAVRLGRMLHL